MDIFVIKITNADTIDKDLLKQFQKKEISDKENLDEKIESLQIELNELDEKLGINKEG